MSREWGTTGPGRTETESVKNIFVTKKEMLPNASNRDDCQTKMGKPLRQALTVNRCPLVVLNVYLKFNNNGVRGWIYCRVV